MNYVRIAIPAHVLHHLPINLLYVPPIDHKNSSGCTNIKCKILTIPYSVQVKSPDTDTSPRNDRMSELVGVWDCFETHARAEDAVLKRVADLEMQRAQLKDIAQVSDLLR